MNEFETTYGLDAEKTTFTTHLACPYVTDVEKQAWCEGYGAATADSVNNVAVANQRENPYTASDTMVAWTQGYQDWSYHPAAFNPTDPFAGVDVEVEEYTKNRSIGVSLFVHTNPTTSQKEAHFVWAWQLGAYQEDMKPAWCENRWEDRSVPIDWFQASAMIKRGMYQDFTPNASIELPCPPYEYEYSEGGMQISAGKFKKWGSKDDWESVVEEMQEKIEDMPEGINIEDISITIDVTVQATLSVSMSATMLCESENGIFHGDSGALEDAIEDGVNSLDSYDFNDYIETSELQYAEPDVTEWSAADVGYDISNS